MSEPFTGPFGWEMSPNDSPKDGTVHPIAVKELAIWEALASEWPTVQTDDGYLRCALCTQAVLRMSDRNGNAYEYDPPQFIAAKVAHLRQVHNTEQMQAIIDEGLKHADD